MRHNGLRHGLAIGVGILISLSTPIYASAQDAAEQEQLVASLVGGTALERRVAAATIGDIPVSQRIPMIRFALEEEIARYQNELQARKDVLNRGGSVSPREDHGEYLFTILNLLIQYEDPTLVDRLIPFLRTGNRVVTAVAYYGELAAPSVLAVASDPTEDVFQVTSALRALDRMLATSSSHPLSDHSRERIVRLAAALIGAHERPTVALGAIKLAVSTRDPELRAEVEVLAKDEAAVRRLGFRDPAMVAAVQAMAQSAIRER